MPTSQRWGYSVGRVYVYKPEILEELSRHGLAPCGHTAPHELRDAIRDLYKYEIKRLKAELLAGQFAKHAYAAKVLELRRRYPLLSVPTGLWTER